MMVAVLAAGSALAFGASPASANVCPALNSGTWIGSWSSVMGPYSGSAQSYLDLTGAPAASGVMTFITGTLALANNTPITGTITCDAVALNIGPNVALTGTVSADGLEMSGTYQYTNPPFSDAGVWHSAIAQHLTTSVGNATFLTTDPGTGATATDPVQTTISDPNSGPLSVASATSNGGLAGGYQLLDQVVLIQATPSMPRHRCHSHSISTAAQPAAHPRRRSRSSGTASSCPIAPGHRRRSRTRVCNRGSISPAAMPGSSC